MTGYSAVGRLGSVEVRRSLPFDVRPEAVWVVGATPSEVEDLAGEDLVERIAEVWEVARERWAMTTFYLFDAEGWR